MNARDFDYIETRLLDQGARLIEAIERLRSCGYHEQADTLVEQLAELTDVCREVRHELQESGR